MNRRSDAVTDGTGPDTAQSKEGRADGAPDLLRFEDGKTDLSALRWIDAPAILIFWVLAVVVFLQFFSPATC
ncbi:hypothetical protein QW131_31165 [Roseibium salinum]|nr:hypothetical protein [Roseibium salinum]